MIKRRKQDEINHPAHYTQGTIEPDDFIDSHNLNFREGNIIKYIIRYKFKGQAEKDLLKAEYFLKKLIKKFSSENGRKNAINVNSRIQTNKIKAF